MRGKVTRVGMNMIRVAYGDNVDAIIKLLARRKAVEFRAEAPTPEEAVNSVNMIITPKYTYLPAKLIKRLAWKVGLNHKRIKKELSHNGKIQYIALEDPLIGEVDRAYMVETKWVLPEIENIVQVPDWFEVEDIPMEPSPIGKALIEAIYKAAEELNREMHAKQGRMGGGV
ncbi:hypothetical protein JCM16307_23400 [Thermococcus prieurii]